MVTTSLILPSQTSATFLAAPLTYLMFGILAELICFTLVLGYRQRRGAIRSAIMEQRLAHEREQYHREQVEAELATEKLQQQMSAGQMMALQAQLNPHFLFNSLNSLSSLIADEPARAERFLDEMASVYRYRTGGPAAAHQRWRTDVAANRANVHRLLLPPAQNPLRNWYRPPASRR